ncbi:dynein assembly factor 4, axonemal-like [Ctenocephalides felis]|uniref:dynein assembly factor 4, axonemal-like n=1 Tax=Ctenocephalides felis TaxID=7515 RepID=UPI000E6E471D|nr:dynein assembly factor 4, axonemal-like [Ctenocephalides felis]
MPIIVKDYVWSQNEESVFVHLSLRGVHPSKVDIFTCDNYIKVNFEKYLCEIFLHQNVIDSESKCLLDDKDVSFELRKEIPEEWSALEADIPKSEKLKLKEEIIKNRMIKEEELKKEKTKRKQEIKSSATQSQIWEDGQLRQQIDLLRKKQQDEFFKDSENPTVEEISEEEEMPIVIKKKKKKKKKIPPNFEGFWPPAPMVDTSKVPEPRASGTISVDFTRREFPTPSRECSAEMESEWLKKQVEAQREMGFTSADLRPEERNPTWLKEKGDDFFNKQNYRSAVNAYTAGIQINSKMPALYANRASAQFNLQHFNRCIDDCTKALELLVPACDANLKARASCIARRGAALCQVGYLGQGIEEMMSALKLDPYNTELKTDIEKAKNKFHNKEE